MAVSNSISSMPPAAKPGTAEAERIRSYLQTQAAKLSLADLIEKVRTDLEQVREAMNAVPAPQFSQRPAENEWSANEVVHHLVQISRIVATGTRSVLDVGTIPPPISDLISTAPEEHTAAEWWARLLADRETILERVGRATGQEHLDVKWEHGVFGGLNWREWLLFMRVHDLDHARQIQAVAQAMRD
jgi:hypothetical protein